MFKLDKDAIAVLCCVAENAAKKKSTYFINRDLESQYLAAEKIFDGTAQPIDVPDYQVELERRLEGNLFDAVNRCIKAGVVAASPRNYQMFLNLTPTGETLSKNYSNSGK